MGASGATRRASPRPQPAVPPLSLYIHIPWCPRKCPYCDFNSHELNADSPYPARQYAQAIIRDLEFVAGQHQGRELCSIFFGGGTPSMMPAAALGSILDAVDSNLAVAPGAEITLEANPGAADAHRFAGYRRLGVNRISLGAQSFNDAALMRLGRVHDASAVRDAATAAAGAGFTNINIDIMYGLPGQTATEALADLEQALALGPEHISWYQLTIEPNTVFHAKPPALPDEDVLWRMQVKGQNCLTRHGYRQYEISAYSRPGRACRHNLNYWRFGDYLGLGAGAHEKITDPNTGTITRRVRRRIPSAYMAAAGGAAAIAHSRQPVASELILEFMLNALRLNDGVPRRLFSERTGLPPTAIQEQLATAVAAGLLEAEPDRIKATAKGARYLDDLLASYFAP